MVIRGETNIIKAYDLTPLVDVSEYDLNDAKDIENFQNAVASYIDNGEAEALSFETELIGTVPENTEIEIEDETYFFEDVEYINKSVDNLIAEQLNENDILCLVQASGDGYFEYEENPNINDLKIGYTACDVDTPDEPIYNFFCDLLLPDLVKVNDNKLEVIAKNFYPKDTMIAEVYIVRSKNRKKYLERICEIDMLHFGWDLLEDIIQVDYDEPIA